MVRDDVRVVRNWHSVKVIFIIGLETPGQNKEEKKERSVHAELPKVG